jgi:hypothetical protein
MEKQDIIKRMRELTAEYKQLGEELNKLDAPERRAQFEAEQRRRLEAFKKELKVEATLEAKEIDYEDVEAKIFSQENLDQQLNSTQDGYMLGYDSEGQPGLGVSYNGGGGFTPFAYDKVDAERYAKRQKRKQKFAAQRK